MKKGRQALLGLKLAFVIVLALVAAELVSLTLRARIEPAPQTVPEPPAANQTMAPAPPDQVIGQTRPLLGSASPAPQPAPGASGAPAAGASGAPAVAAGPDPLQGMTLMGTMVGGTASVAFFHSAQGKDVMLHHDENVGSWKVAEILENSVTLSQGSAKRTVYMPSLQGGASAQSTSPGGGILPPPPVPTMANPPQGPGEKSLITKAEVSAMMSNPGPEMQNFRILPFSKEGRNYGSKVHYLKPGSFLTRMGLQQDDILLSVSNRPVNNPDDFFMVWQTLQKEDHTTLSIERGGRPITVQVEIR